MFEWLKCLGFPSSRPGLIPDWLGVQYAQKSHVPRYNTQASEEPPCISEWID